MKDEYKVTIELSKTVTNYFRAMRVLNILSLVADELFGLKDDDDIEKYVSDISVEDLEAFQELSKRFTDLPSIYMTLFKSKNNDEIDL